MHNNPETFDGIRDYLAVNYLISKIESNPIISNLSNPDALLSEESRIALETTFLMENAEIWWYNLIQSSEATTY